MISRRSILAFLGLAPVAAAAGALGLSNVPLPPYQEPLLDIPFLPPSTESRFFILNMEKERLVVEDLFGLGRRVVIQSGEQWQFDRFPTGTWIANRYHPITRDPNETATTHIKTKDGWGWAKPIPSAPVAA